MFLLVENNLVLFIYSGYRTRLAVKRLNNSKTIDQKDSTKCLDSI